MSIRLEANSPQGSQFVFRIAEYRPQVAYASLHQFVSNTSAKNIVTTWSNGVLEVVRCAVRLNNRLQVIQRPQAFKRRSNFAIVDTPRVLSYVVQCSLLPFSNLCERQVVVVANDWFKKKIRGIPPNSSKLFLSVSEDTLEL